MATSTPQFDEAEALIQHALSVRATTLDLSKMEMGLVPSSIGSLVDLTELNLSQNGLTEVPKELANLTNLRELHLDNNKVKTIPRELGRIVSLNTLYLYENHIESLPKELGNLVNLEELHLDRNHLRRMPCELGNLANLRLLDLSGNQIESIPKELGNLVNLGTLNLSKNQLTTIPQELGALENLTMLRLSQNPNLASPPPEVISQGTPAILVYLQAQKDSGERQWISKLLVVGEGGVGKTTLLRSLRGEPFKSQQTSTHGIDINTLSLPHPTVEDVTMTLNTWDFGGQEIYHATHQFFLTNRSLFLLAFNARLGFEQGKLIYWLKTIRANAPDSPVILVATWSDERNADLPLSDLKRQFPQVISLFEISNKTKLGIKELQKAITHATSDLPLMGEVWPTTWLRFTDAIRKGKKRQATPKQFWDAMAQEDVSESGRYVLANWLHELGDILFFQEEEEVNDLVILKPQWVTEYISKVLTDEEVIVSNGIFTRQCMDRIWAELRPGLRDFFLRLMERFDLSYRTLENRDISLVVERLPFEPPDFQSQWKKKKQEPNCKEISMKFQVSEILPGIPTWFIARQHRFTIDKGERRGIHWRTGVLFQDREGKHLGLVRILRNENTNADYLHLAVRGPVPHNFFDILREGLELTLHRYPGLKITRLIHCPDPTNVHCPHEFDYADLTQRLERVPPRETIECPKCLEDISVTELLFGLHYTTQNTVIRKLDQLQISNDQLRASSDQLRACNQDSFDSLKASVEQGFSELRELVQRDLLREIRTTQKQMESPCPSVFVLRPDNRRFWQQNIAFQRMSIQLYCECPGCLHPVRSGGIYEIDNPKRWLFVMKPHLNRLFGIIKYITPVIGPWINVTAADYGKLISDDIALTQSLVDKLPEIKLTDDDRSFIEPGLRTIVEGSTTQKVSGASLRMLYEFLKRKDPGQVWGGLVRTTTPEGDVLWLCEDHVREIYPTTSKRA